ncbi:MAG: hypothetical protein JWO30_4619 [Fibrobacteres bacterium]|nr:hypothetical protein [Fibrobacterota bacterium]
MRVLKAMRLPGPLALILLMGVLQSCCGPQSCPQAKSGAAVLDKAVSEIEKYKERNGRYPVLLDDIKPGFGRQVEMELKADCPDCIEFAYKTDSFGYQIEYVYPHMGRNRCLHNNEMETWDCKGIY